MQNSSVVMQEGWENHRTARWPRGQAPLWLEALLATLSSLSLSRAGLTALVSSVLCESALAFTGGSAQLPGDTCMFQRPGKHSLQSSVEKGT